MIVIWKIIRNFAVEKFNKMPMDYRHIKVLHHLTSSFNSLLPQTCGKQMKRSKTSEIKHTQSSFIFHLFFLCSILIMSSCGSDSKYDFKSSSDAISAYRDFHHSIHSESDVKAEQLADFICQWQELSDTVYNYIKKDPAFTAHAALSMDFGLITDSIRMGLMRHADNCSMKDVAYIKLNTSPYRDDAEFDVVKKKAATFFAALDRQPVYNNKSTRELLFSYQQFLVDTRTRGINNQKQLLEFIETEDRHFRTFLSHLDEYSDMGLGDITKLTELICTDVYKSVSENKLTSEEVMVYMSMRTDRRLLLNAQVCHDHLKKGKVKSASQANAYLWMMIQPYLSMDSFAIAMLTDSQRELMLAIADDYSAIVPALGAKDYTDAKISLQIPTQLMRLYISTL